MDAVPTELIQQSIAIMGRTGVTQEEIESEVLAIAQDQMIARRLIDWITEAFGMVLVGHLSSAINLPTTFSAKSSSGKWVTLKLTVEPIFVEAVRLAQSIYHEGPADVFKNIAVRSSMSNTINNALNEGTNLDGAVLSGPALMGIPAEVYPAPAKTIWEKFFEWRLARLRKAKR